MDAEQFAAKVKSWADYPFAHQPDAVRSCADMVFESVSNNFSRAEDAQGTPWPAHSPLTIALHGPHPLLTLTGKMKAMASGGAGSMRSKEFSKTQTVMRLKLSGAKGQYWQKHQFGSNGKPRIPRRQFFYLHKSDRPQVVAKTRETIIQKIRKDLRWR